jgi:hypothetical protein
MRALIVDDEARANVARVLSHAEQNHYHPERAKGSPGDDPHFVAYLGTYRCVFSYTHSDGAVWRHLSISVPGKNYPNPFAAFTIAELFGFTGWDQKNIDPTPEGWEFAFQEHVHAVVLAQIVRAGALAN